MELFDRFERAYQGYALHKEDAFTFLNRSARIALERVRQLLEGWFQEYPKHEQPSLRARFRSEFPAAFFELFVHELLRQLGANVTVHPAVAGESKKPDFLAIFPFDRKVFVEAVLATDVSKEETGETALLNTLYDEINRVKSPNFFIELQRMQNPNRKQPSARRVRSFLERAFVTRSR